MEIVSTTELCQRLDISRQALSKWKKEGCPHEGHGKWDIDDVMGWRMRNKSTGQGQTKVDKNLQQQKIEAEVAYRQAKAEREKLLLKELKGQFLKKEDVYEAWACRIQEITSALEMLARALAPRLVDRSEREIRGILDDEFRHLREQYARGSKYTPSIEVEPEGENGMEAAG